MIDKETKEHYKELLKDCVKTAIELGRPYMEQYASDSEPTKEEWALALILFQNNLIQEVNIVPEFY